MTDTAFQNIVKGMKSIYTSESFIPDEFAYRMWYLLLQDLDSNDVQQAVVAHMSLSTFPPTPAEIRKMVTKLKSTRKAVWGDAWQEVLDAIHRFGLYRENEALGGMSEATVRVVKNLGWQNICASENLSVTQAQFRDIYNRHLEEQTEHERLPESIKQAIAKNKDLDRLTEQTVKQMIGEKHGTTGSEKKEIEV